MFKVSQRYNYYAAFTDDSSIMLCLVSIWTVIMYWFIFQFSTQALQSANTLAFSTSETSKIAIWLMSRRFNVLLSYLQYSMYERLVQLRSSIIHRAYLWRHRTSPASSWHVCSCQAEKCKQRATVWVCGLCELFSLSYCCGAMFFATLSQIPHDNTRC